LSEDRFGVFSRLVSNLFTKIVALTELLANDLYDVIGVAVSLSEDKRLGNLITIGENLGYPPYSRKRISIIGAREI
jgi:hypothetical protein